MFLNINRLLFIFGLCILSFASNAAQFNITPGWNLLGNSSSAPIDVAATFGDPAKFTTVWKWNKLTNKWAFYAPSLAPAALSTYAQSKGYDLLVSIDPKEGFWVNASVAVAVSGPVANGLTLVESDLQRGWNLVSSADNLTPSQLNLGLSNSLNAAGITMVTAWAWDAPTLKWKFYSPSLEAQGGTALSNYIASKSYLPFSTVLSATDGFWLNMSPVTCNGTGANAVNQAIVTGASPSHLQVSNGNLIWSEAGETPIKRIPVTGGNPIVLAKKFSVPANLTLLGTDMYSLDDRSGIAPSGCTGPGVIRVLNKTSANGVTTQLGMGDNCGFGASSNLVTDGTHVYWVTSTASPNTFVIQKTPIAGGVSTVIASTLNPIVSMVVSAGNLFWMENFFPMAGAAIWKVSTAGGAPVSIASGFTSRASSLAVNSTSLFYTTANFPSGDNLVKVTQDGVTTTPLATLATTPQKMIADDSNVYWLDGVSVSSLPVVGGTATVLANTVNSPLDLIASTTDIFWTESTGMAHGETGAVKTIPKTGGAVVVLYQGGDAPRQLFMDASWIYWTEGGPIGLIEGFGRIARMPIVGGTVETVASGISSDSPPIAASDTHVFIADKFTIKKVPLCGGVVTKLTTTFDNVINLVTDGINVYWVEGGLSNVKSISVQGGTITHLGSATGIPGISSFTTGPIRLQNGTLYWATGYDSLLAVPSVGGTVQVIATALPFLSDFVTDASHIYYSELGTKNIKKIPLAGGASITLAQADWRTPYISLAVDGSNLYWIDSKQIGKVSTAGGASTVLIPQVLAPVDTFPASIAPDGVGLYWTEPGVGMILKTAK